MDQADDFLPIVIPAQAGIHGSDRRRGGAVDPGSQRLRRFVRDDEQKGRWAANVKAVPLALYVHFPWTRAIPPYCDHYSLVDPTFDEARWAGGVLAALERLARPLRESRLISVFIGGGVPSLMRPETLGRLLGGIDACFGSDPSREVTLEADPEPPTVGSFAAFRAAGVNRLSLRIRSLRDGGLRVMRHGWTAAEARASLEAALAAFPRVAVDLCFGWPEQTVAGWLAELEEAVGLGPEQVALQELAPSSGTEVAGRGAHGALRLAGDEAREAMYLEGVARLEALGLELYETVHFARPGGRGRHNDHVWRGGAYLGIGPGAVGRLGMGGTREELVQIADPDRWYVSVETGGDGLLERRRLGAEERRLELVSGALRRREGLATADCRRMLGAAPADVLPSGPLEALVADGFLELDAEGLRATAAGRPLLDSLLARLLTR